jgi:DNA repair protein RecN (Recombination protein N)
MLTSLSIRNFALIEKLSIDFSGGFSTITGETGAGKSILLGALGLVLGKRADLSSLKHKDEKCIVEACFDISDYKLQEFFEANDLDYEDSTILRREILPSGKSRAFINDSPVNLPELQELGQFLIDIHSQHQTQELSDEHIQFGIIDAIAENQEKLALFSSMLKSFRESKQRLALLESALRDAAQEQDYNTFLLEELVSAKLAPDMQASMESEYEQLSNVEFIKENLSKSLVLSDDEQFGVLQNLKEVKSVLQRIASISADYQNLSERVGSVAIEFDDIVSEIHRFSERLTDNPERQEVLNQQLQLIYSLQKKHQVNAVEELLEIQAGLENKVVSVEKIENEISEITIKIAEIKSELDNRAKAIHDNRLKAIPVLSQRLVELLSLLGMPNARFDIRLTLMENYAVNGKDELTFLFSANKGSDFGLLKKVASGGEMSRIMLAVKAVLAQYSKLPTIIFDEIDTGVSGEIASKIAEIMKAMSSDMQVFAITHLPQIAASGDRHFKVFKSVTDGQTQSELKLLDYDERVTEIAEMLSGTSISDSAINHAKALLN